MKVYASGGIARLSLDRPVTIGIDASAEVMASRTSRLDTSDTTLSGHRVLAVTFSEGELAPVTVIMTDTVVRRLAVAIAPYLRPESPTQPQDHTGGEMP